MFDSCDRAMPLFHDPCVRGYCPVNIVDRDHAITAEKTFTARLALEAQDVLARLAAEVRVGDDKVFTIPQEDGAQDVSETLLGGLFGVGGGLIIDPQRIRHADGQ